VEGRIAAMDPPRALRLAHGRRVVRVEVKLDGTLTAHEFALDGIGADPEFAALLRAGGIETIHTLETTLEDVFVKVTGKALA
jgi:fluoroquinolone transport system ATP-binding protein